ncbi:MAG: metallophosphoesterase family protein [Microthrixaceae bacterium]|nr:metallophosphoesterase family protein [Actinomycetota bacterium]HMS11718.1 metallophosphoesterase family protein [Microthrixaceae bacterium]HMT22780.1 metallophosphoesterase family protein [Microthrixaceae bacterium]HMT59860.1 metallophosphoesterase family protein [Microthrixaceae bacterium]
MARWFTSDLHLGHANIIRYCDRPFHSVGEMNAALISRWNEVVAPDDEVWVLGDFAMGRLEETLPLTGALAGRKTLLTGNHDPCWAGKKGRTPDSVAQWRGEYYRAGFETILDGCVELNLGAKRVLACHFPYRGDSGDHDRYLDHRPSDDGSTWLLHGHIHENGCIEDRMINVGVDVWDFRPVSESDLVDLIELSEESAPLRP